MDPQHIEWLGPTAVSVFTVLTGLYAMFKWIVPRVRKLGHLIDDMFGEEGRAGVPARPGIMERLEDTSTRLSNLELRTKELIPNSGSSIKDTVHRIDVRLEALDSRVEKLEKHEYL